MTTSTLTTSPWKDGKRALWLLSPGLPLVALAGIALGGFAGWSWAFWAMPVCFFVLLPLLDLLVGEDEHNPPESAAAQLEGDDYYRKLVIAFIPIQLATLIVGAYLAMHGGLAGWELAGLIVSMGLVQGLGINTAHELGHKRESRERWLAKLTLAPTAYGHFFIEHNKGHHKNVATPEDPASSRMGESLWAFLPRTLSGGLKSAWRIEAARLRRQDQPVLSLHNETIQSWLMTAVLFGGLALWLGPLVLPLLLLQGLIGGILLEVVNYIEHYGLLRQREPGGRYERCSPRHSWNNNHIVSNLVFYQLQRHSDHHANPTRSFQALRHFDHSPQLPAGYAAMMILALFPPLWFAVMDPRVAAHWGYDMNRAHLAPGRRAQLMARWHRGDSAAQPAGAGRLAA